MSLASRLIAQIQASMVGAQTLWLEYRAAVPTPVNGDLVAATCDADGNMRVAIAGFAMPTALDVEGTGVAGTPAGGVLSVQGVVGGTAQPVSAASLPLPTGAATSALQGGGLPAALAAGGGLKVEGVVGGVAQPISAASLPLPSGAATSALQGGGLPAALVGGRLDVVVGAALPAGSALIGKVAPPTIGAWSTLADVTVPQTTAAAISTTAAILEVTIKALSTNTTSVRVGPSDITPTRGHELAPGESATFRIADIASVFSVSAATGQKVAVTLVTA